MDKLKKFLVVPVVCHVALLVAMVILYTLNNAGALLVTSLELMVGAMVTPMFLAVMSVVHAILHDGKVYDYIYYCLGYLVLIGVLRIVVYVLSKGGVTGALVALASFVVSVGVFTLWDCLFALTDRMMKKRPGKRGKNK